MSTKNPFQHTVQRLPPECLAASTSAATTVSCSRKEARSKTRLRTEHQRTVNILAFKKEGLFLRPLFGICKFWRESRVSSDLFSLISTWKLFFSTFYLDFDIFFYLSAF